MTSEIKDCLPPVRTPRKPGVVLPKGSLDTHVHIFEPGYPLSPARGYNPPYSTLADLKHLHATLGIDRVVFTQPSIYGTDNSAILKGMAALNAQTPNRARCVVAISVNVSDDELASHMRLYYQPVDERGRAAGPERTVRLGHRQLWPIEVKRMLVAAGFRLLGAFADFAGSALPDGDGLPADEHVYVARLARSR